MKRSLFITFIALFCFQVGIAQNITAKVVDSKSGESIPYASIRVKDSDNLISNSEGYFTIPENKGADDSMLIVSYLGYVNRQMTIRDLKSQQFIIRLEPGIFELETVKISAKPDPYAIMAEVKKNLTRNYKRDEQPSKDMLFYRDATTLKPEQLNIEMTESKRLDKKGRQAENAKLAAFTSKVIARPPLEFKDMLCNYYSTIKKDKDDKQITVTKLEVVKATNLKDQNRTFDRDDMNEVMEKLFSKHLDSTKYYRFKTGLLGFNDTISGLKKSNKINNKNAPTQLMESKMSLSDFMGEHNFLQSDKLDFVNKPALFEYTYEGAMYSNENEFVYILNFKPRGGGAKYTGKLYVSETDFAVVRADYTLAEGEVEGGLNLKWLFGIKFSQNFSKGTLIFKQKTNGTGYYLQYASKESGTYFYLHRPLKFIEITAGKKDVVAYDLKIEANIKDKKEFLNISRGEITEAAYDEFKEEDFSFINLKRYDPKIWKDYGAIEPLEEMKRFRVLD